MKSTLASRLVADDRHAGTACPACHVDVSEGDVLQVCDRCGAAHHSRCWDKHGECQAYACAPAQREAIDDQPAVVITYSELDAAAPLPKPAPAVRGWSPSPSPPSRRLSRAAIASLVLATLAFGLGLLHVGLSVVQFTTPGLIAGSLSVVMALGAMLVGLVAASTMGQRVRGTGFIVGGITLAAIDFVICLITMVVLVDKAPSIASSDFADVDFRPDAESLKDLDPAIGRGMRANVLIVRNMPWSGRSMGSGVILRMDRGDAIIVTNRHVIEGGAPQGDVPLDSFNDGRLFVTFVGQDATPARVVWIAPHNVDFAILRAACRSQEAVAARWSRGRKARVGDPVFAIGNPHGLGWTHTMGAVSQFRMFGFGPGEVRVIQTQSPLNPGNSGGGLYSREGWLLGINTWTADKRIGEGLGFAVELDGLLSLSPPGLGDGSDDAAGGRETP